MSSVQGLSGLSAIVLAGGLGTRLRSVVQDRPKVLAAVNGRPFLSFILDQLHGYGIRHVVLSVGYLADLVVQSFGSSYRGIALDYCVETQPLGTGGAIRLACDQARSQTALVLNGDSYCRTDLNSFYQEHLHSSFGASLVLTRVEDISRFGQVELAADSPRIARFSEKGSGQGAGLINAGIYLLDAPLLAGIPRGRAVSIEQEMFPCWLNEGMQGVAIGREFIDIGTPATYGIAEEFFRRHHDL
jgi:D-glycero-alpha-D-manno-heptose 1-phosphate guanylyltransferase